MGQYWRIVNIDKRQHLGHWGKLGECFFSGSANTLVDYLAVPSPENLPHPAHRFNGPSLTGSWAGDRVICVGDEGDDVPAGVLSSGEAREFAKMTRIDLEGEDASDSEGEEEDAQRSIGYINLSCAAGRFFEQPRSRYFGKDGFADDQVYVLRNLTKREYVRADAVNVCPDEMRGPFLRDAAWGYRPGLGEVLLSRICWSSDPSAGMYYGLDGVGLTRGAWAGDRFDIGTVDSVVSDSGETDQWRDISKEVAEEIFAIYTADRGEDWRKAGRKKL